MNKVRWGVLSTAAIGTAKVIPAMQKSPFCEMVGLASRDPDRARAAVAELGMKKAYGSYEELLADPQIDAVYNPLPNHLHVPWTVKALEAGKHVLCEKPIGLDVAQARELQAVAESFSPRLKVMEAFMYRFHPQWRYARTTVEQGVIGELRTIQTFFSYFNRDPANIRNQVAIGGGGLMDIGCYPISQARFLFAAEPEKVCGLIDIDPQFKTDRIASAILQFARGTATFTCSTQLSPFQRTQIVGTEGRIEIEIPVNAPPDKSTLLRLWNNGEAQEKTFPPCDQYQLQGDAFSQAILNDEPVPVPLADAVANMQVIEAIVRSHHSARWVDVD